MDPTEVLESTTTNTNGHANSTTSKTIASFAQDDELFYDAMERFSLLEVNDDDCLNTNEQGEDDVSTRDEDERTMDGSPLPHYHLLSI